MPTSSRKKLPNKPIASIQCKFAVYVPPREPGEPDFHYVKELITYEDGEKVNNIRMIRDFKRSFGVTKPFYRTHKSKRESEQLDRLIVEEVPQRELWNRAAKALGMGFVKNNRLIKQSPYLYGADVPSTSLLKKRYVKKYPNARDVFTMAVCDTEKDVIHGTNEINMCTISMGKTVYTVVNRQHAPYPVTSEAALQAIQTYLGEDYGPRGIVPEVVFVDREIDILKKIFAKAHELQPDLLVFWNINFDIPEILKACDRAGIRPEEIFCDPTIPKSQWYFKYKPGPLKKVTRSGVETSIPVQMQWHTVFCTSSFYCVDAMAIYKRLRLQMQEERSYSLDAILSKELGRRKLNFSFADHVQKIAWHRLMQEKYFYEYIAYNQFDCVGIELLNEKTKDITLKFPHSAKEIDFMNFNSFPQQLTNNLYTFYYERGHMLGVGDRNNLEEEIDEQVLELSGWITTLDARLTRERGPAIFHDLPGIWSRLYQLVADLDVRSAYPTNQVVSNMSKATTSKELLDIKGRPESLYRMQNLGLSAGPVNALEYCQTMFKFPTLQALTRAFENHPTLHGGEQGKSKELRSTDSYSL